MSNKNKKEVTQETVITKEDTSSSRTEEQILAGIAFTVTYGGKTYNIKELSLKDDIDFTSHLGDFLSKYLEAPSSIVKDGFKSLYQNLYGNGLKDLMSLPFEYDKTLDKETIWREANTEELIEGGYQLLDFLFPFIMTVLQRFLKFTQRVKAVRV